MPGGDGFENRFKRECSLPIELNYTYDSLENRMPSVRTLVNSLPNRILSDAEYASIEGQYNGHGQQNEDLFQLRTKVSDLAWVEGVVAFVERHIDNGALTDKGIIDKFNKYLNTLEK